ncbi:MAG TPA: hypothetical protein PK020_03860 [Ilumatobacteraceae bacterium]|nr:hypothetical protein [Ilumatobacteraceae bacterium]HRB02752.1 hypothetical protein [Ilumatobacteraceae bacterium]
MNRKLLTALTVATVAGTGGAAYATVTDTSPSPTEGLTNASPISTPSLTDVATSVVTTYRVGDAGSVTLELAAGAMSTRNVEPSAGWAVTSMTNSATHAVIVFQNAERVVGLTADLVGTQAVVSVTNDRISGNTGEAPIDPLIVTVGDGANGIDSTKTTPPVIPATPAAGRADTSKQPPSASQTTAPSGSETNGDSDHSDDHGDHESDDHESDDHGSDGHDHESDDHSDGHDDGGDDD